MKPLDINYYIDDETHEMQTLFTEFRPLGFATTSGEFVELNIQYLGENIVEDFEIADGVVISPDRYWFTRYEIQAESFSGRPIFGEIAVNWGGSMTEPEPRSRAPSMVTKLVWRFTF